MKNLTYIFAFLFIGWSATAAEMAKSVSINFYDEPFIFVEDGVEFAVYPNGEFDFYFNPDFRRGSSFHVATPNVNISYNSGYNYEPYVQYDDYGAVIQIETVPVYYDYYGRIVQAGNVVINYNSFGMVASIGNMYMHYNNFHHFTHCSGFVNIYNRHYGYRPWHDYYRRPSVNVSIVFNQPYRAYYQPQRISYNRYVTVYNTYYSNHNGRRNFYRPNDRVASYHYGERTQSKREIRSVHRTNDRIAQSRQSASRQAAERNKRTTRNSDYSGRSQKDRSQSQIYSGRNERSTNSRGRSVERNIPQNRKGVYSRTSPAKRSEVIRNRNTQSRTSRSERKPDVQSGSHSRIERKPATTQRSATRSSHTVKPQVHSRSQSRVQRKPATIHRKSSARSSRSHVEKNRTISRPTMRSSSVNRSRSIRSNSDQ
ncbi:hypothetical protein [Christiangramia fulva]|nr:hypothetical protein [Christiangramia fulva]